ncbi:MAG: histone deacetylase family protein [Candidatus Zixiibacteriota bacterium]|nr:MAG: histone deacetylase family protein [candidate division Zixibacteria bacterium]
MKQIGLAIVPNEKDHSSPPEHPERPGKLALVLDELKKPKYSELTQPIKPGTYDETLLHRVHKPEYIRRLATFSESGIGYLDPDTYLSSTSFGASCKVTWSLLNGIDLAFGDGPAASFILGRPPGHHTEVDHGMGFCLVNHIAVAAQYALDHHKIERVAIVDFDIHHGNGTQHIFYDRDDILYISTHQYPFYPGTGSEQECGQDAGEGFTLNFPLPAGTGDKELTHIVNGKMSSRLRKFEPDLILVSAGFDGHYRDPLGGFRLTGQGFYDITRALRELAGELCDGRIVSLLEGGYDPDGNLDSITNHIRGLAGL